VLCCFVQHGAFPVEVTTAKLQEFFGPILMKNIKISNAHAFGNTGPISKIPILLSSEA